MRGYLARCARLITPCLLLGLALWGRRYVSQLDGQLHQLLVNLPYLVAALNVAAGGQFRRLRLVLAAGGCAALYWLIQSQLQVSLASAGAARLYLIASLAVPLLASCLFLAPECGVLSRQGLVTTLAYLGLLGLCLPLADWILSPGNRFTAHFAPRVIEGYVLSPGATVMTAVAALAGMTRLLRRDSEVDAALLGAVLCAYTALAWLHLDYISPVTAIACQACLAWGLLRSSYLMAFRDDLTGLLSRRALNERLKTLGRRYTIAMLDIDHFKKVNDTHGHEVGDEVLRFVASRIKHVGGGGTAYRYGGEEFCIVFPRRSVEDCAVVLEQVREGIAGYRLSIRDRKRRPLKAREGSRRRGATRLRFDQLSVTVSAGLAARSEDCADSRAVIQAADARLYRAKRAGRNRVVY